MTDEENPVPNRPRSTRPAAERTTARLQGRSCPAIVRDYRLSVLYSGFRAVMT
jgi:hypothetical protein